MLIDWIGVLITVYHGHCTTSQTILHDTSGYVPR